MEERPRTINEAIIKSVDARTDSPEVRMKKVWEKIKQENFDYWSLAWFCVTYLTGLSSTLPYLKEPMLDIGKLLYNHHYLFPEQLNLFDSEFGGKENGILKE
jgi:ABC-type microcin C transport system permease subunit YejE